jgi:hypothetical protein
LLLGLPLRGQSHEIRKTDWVKRVGVEAWLKTFPSTRGRKAKIRNIMSAWFSHAIRREWADCASVSTRAAELAFTYVAAVTPDIRQHRPVPAQ